MKEYLFSFLLSKYVNTRISNLSLSLVKWRPRSFELTVQLLAELPVGQVVRLLVECPTTCWIVCCIAVSWTGGLGFNYLCLCHICCCRHVVLRSTDAISVTSTVLQAAVELFINVTGTAQLSWRSWNQTNCKATMRPPHLFFVIAARTGRGGRIGRQWSSETNDL